MIQKTIMIAAVLALVIIAGAALYSNMNSVIPDDFKEHFENYTVYSCNTEEPEIKNGVGTVSVLLGNEIDYTQGALTEGQAASVFEAAYKLFNSKTIEINKESISPTENGIWVWSTDYPMPSNVFWVIEGNAVTMQCV